MSRLRSIWVVSMQSIFDFHLHFHHDSSYHGYSYNHTNTCSFPYFLEYVLLFLDDNMDEECE